MYCTGTAGNRKQQHDITDPSFCYWQNTLSRILQNLNRKQKQKSLQNLQNSNLIIYEGIKCKTSEAAENIFRFSIIIIIMNFNSNEHVYNAI